MMTDADFYNRYWLADHLGQPVGVVEAMTLEQFTGHLIIARLKAKGAGGDG